MKPFVLLLFLVQFVRCQIQGGTNATQGQFPYAVQIHQKMVPWPVPSYICSGAIIHKKWVVTAAHCVRQYKITLKISVIAGDIWRFKHEGESVHRVEYTADKVIYHPGYDSSIWKFSDWRLSDYHFDIALLYFKNGIEFDDNDVINNDVGRIPLPLTAWPLRPNTNNPSAGDKCNVMGWGMTLIRNGKDVNLSDRLKWSELRVRGWGALFYDVSKKHTSREIRVNFGARKFGAGYTFPLAGDSGGPLVCRNSSGNDVLYGVFYGHFYGGEITDDYLVYTSVAYNLKWIYENMGNIEALLQQDVENERKLKVAAVVIGLAGGIWFAYRG